MMEAYFCPQCGEPTDYRPVCTHCAQGPTPYYIIKDWTGKTCFFGKTFPTFDDAWSFIYVALEKEIDEDERTLDEYHVEEHFTV